jgi:hypothetical protein
MCTEWARGTLEDEARRIEQVDRREARPAKHSRRLISWSHEIGKVKWDHRGKGRSVEGGT